MKNNKEIEEKFEVSQTVKNQIWASTIDIGVSTESREWLTRYWIRTKFKEAMKYKNKRYTSKGYEIMCTKSLYEIKGMIFYMYSVGDIDECIYVKLRGLAHAIDMKL